MTHMILRVISDSMKRHALNLSRNNLCACPGSVDEFLIVYPYISNTARVHLKLDSCRKVRVHCQTDSRIEYFDISFFISIEIAHGLFRFLNRVQKYEPKIT